MKAPFMERLLFNISRFLSFFLLLCAITTIVIILFMRGMPIEEAIIRRNAPQTFLAVLIMTLAGCSIDALRRYGTIQRPLRRILSTLEQLRQGNFTARLDISHRDINRTGFGLISQEINVLAQELSSVETLRSDFISNVSHELKTPIAVIANYAALLRTPGLTEEERSEYTESLTAVSRRLSDMISNILKLNKLENQQIFPEVQRFDLGAQLCESLVDFESLWEEKSLNLHCDVEDRIFVTADPELLRLVWNNLFSNAIKFTPNGGSISLSLKAEEGWAVVTVTDTGCGMNKETGAHIFEKFYQGDTSHATQGNGLGLALVKRVVDITGGAITVSSTPGKGSAFTVRLETS